MRNAQIVQQLKRVNIWTTRTVHACTRTAWATCEKTILQCNYEQIFNLFGEIKSTDGAFG